MVEKQREEKRKKSLAFLFVCSNTCICCSIWVPIESIPSFFVPFLHQFLGLFFITFRSTLKVAFKKASHYILKFLFLINLNIN